MKILVCLLAVLAITAPVLATEVWISGQNSVGTTLTLSYYVLPDTDTLRGIALAIDTGDELVTTNDAGTTKGANWNVCLDHAYDVVTAAGTYNLDDGGPLAIIDGPGVPAGDVSNFSICIGYVDEGGGQAGVPVGSQASPEELCTIELSAECTVTVTGDMLRGGAVGSPVDIVLDMDNDGTPDDGTIHVGGTDCFAGDATETTNWNGWAKPLNWCSDCWRNGDINADCVITWGGDVQYVYDDLLAIAADLNPAIPDPTPEALAKAASGRSDLNMDGAVTFADLSNASGTGVYDILLLQNSTVPPVNPCPVPCTNTQAEHWVW